MAYFSHVTNESQLKIVYRKLAFMFHPDRGGDLAIMQRINEEYQALCDSLKEKKAAPSFKSLDDIELGDTVFVNGTECTVTEVYSDCFLATAKGRNRSALFDKSTGVGKNNPKFRASYFNMNYN